MGLSATIAAGVAAAFKTLDDIPKSITYNAVTLGVYDPATDTQTPSVVSTVISVVESTIKETEQDWTPALRSSKKIIIEAVDLATPPDTNDYLTMDGKRWEIIKQNPVPGDSVYILFVRQP